MDVSRVVVGYEEARVEEEHRAAGGSVSGGPTGQALPVVSTQAAVATFDAESYTKPLRVTLVTVMTNCPDSELDTLPESN